MNIGNRVWVGEGGHPENYYLGMRVGWVGGGGGGPGYSRIGIFFAPSQLGGGGFRSGVQGERESIFNIQVVIGNAF